MAPGTGDTLPWGCVTLSSGRISAWLLSILSAESTFVSCGFCLFPSLRDGIPPYRVGSKKQLQREMHRSVKANGQVSLPHFPVSILRRGRRLIWATLRPEEEGWEVEEGKQGK